jgi:hypothetical protein
MSKPSVTDSQIATLAFLRTKDDAARPPLVQSEMIRSDDAVCVYLEVLEHAKKESRQAAEALYDKFMKNQITLAGFRIKHFQDSQKALATYKTIRLNWDVDDDDNSVVKHKDTGLPLLPFSQARDEVKTTLEGFLAEDGSATIGDVHQKLGSKWDFPNGILRTSLFKRPTPPPRPQSYDITNGASNATSCSSLFNGVLASQNPSTANAAAFRRKFGNMETAVELQKMILEEKEK